MVAGVYMSWTDFFSPVYRCALEIKKRPNSKMFVVRPMSTQYPCNKVVTTTEYYGNNVVSTTEYSYNNVVTTTEYSCNIVTTAEYSWVGTLSVAASVSVSNL